MLREPKLNKGTKIFEHEQNGLGAFEKSVFPNSTFPTNELFPFVSATLNNY